MDREEIETDTEQAVRLELFPMGVFGPGPLDLEESDVGGRDDME